MWSLWARRAPLSCDAANQFARARLQRKNLPIARRDQQDLRVGGKSIEGVDSGGAGLGGRATPRSASDQSRERGVCKAFERRTAPDSRSTFAGASLWDAWLLLQKRDCQRPQKSKAKAGTVESVRRSAPV